MISALVYVHLLHTQATYMLGSPLSPVVMSDEEAQACNGGETFDTLDQLKSHAEENHPDLYEEKFED